MATCREHTASKSMQNGDRSSKRHTASRGRWGVAKAGVPRGDVGGELRRHQIMQNSGGSFLASLHPLGGRPGLRGGNRASSARAAPGDVSGRRRKTYAGQQGSFLSNEKPGQSAGLIASVTFGN